MRKRALVICTLMAGGALLPTSASWARVRPSDAAATHAYLEAKLEERQAVRASQEPGIRAIEALAQKVQSECPGVLANMPHDARGGPLNEAAREIIEEVVLATFWPWEQVVHPALARFDALVRPLHWSNPKLTKLLYSLALEQDEQAALAAPPLCADLQSFVASGYTRTSPQTQLFGKEIGRISSITVIDQEPGESGLEGIADLNGLVARRLKHYEAKGDRRLARRALQPEMLLWGSRLRPWLLASEQVEKALGLPPVSLSEPR